MQPKDKNIEKKYKEKINLLKKYNREYFDEDNPSITDQEYDQIKQDIIKLEEKYIFLKSAHSPSVKVGYKPSDKFKKAEHDVPMLSLSNAFSKKNIEDFIKKIRNFLNLKDNESISFSSEPKIDGISASL